MPLFDPIPVTDGWACFPDGTVAAVRAQDYHVDWIAPDGMRASSRPLPHQWTRLSDSVKAVLVDLLQRYLAIRATGVVRLGRPDDAITISRPIFGQAVDPAEVSDYVAPFSRARADADGNLWIQETQDVRGNDPRDPFAADKAPVFDIVNRAGVMIDRVQIPGGTFLMGFGPHVAYIMSDLGNGYQLARARIK